MKKKRMISAAVLLALSVGFCQVPQPRADSAGVKPYISFGENLSKSEKNTVLELMGLSEPELADYEIVEVSNAEEHQYLDNYLDKGVIGTRALSSVKIEEADAGSGITVKTSNITFCTKEMYTNALATAGITDADVVVAAPFQISGTAALVGAMKAYGTMTGDVVDAESADAANFELVVTGEFGNDVGQEDAANYVALLKNKVVGGDLSSEEEIQKAIDEVSEELGISVSDENRQRLLELMKKIADLDLDLDSLKKQAESVYNKLKELDIDVDGAKSFLGKVFQKIGGFFSSLWDAVTSWFS